MIGVALRSAASSTSTPGRREAASARARAWRRIRSERFRLPFVISFAVKRDDVRLTGTTWYLVLRATVVRRGMSGPRAGRTGGLRAVLAAALLPVADAGGVERATDDVVLDRRQVLDLPAADQHHG